MSYSTRCHIPRLTWFAFAAIFTACIPSQDDKENLFSAEDLRKADRSLIEVAMEDGFSPPVAARVFAYPHLAHYITLGAFRPEKMTDITRSLNGWNEPVEMEVGMANAELSALLAFCRVARIVVFSEQDMDALHDKFVAQARDGGMQDEVIAASASFAEAMAAHFKPWIATDGYIETRTMDRYTSNKSPGHWIETPLDYTPALEPYWDQMRPFVIDSASAHPVLAPPPYSKEQDSEFHQMVLEVLEGSKVLDDEQRSIALYWDDNPNISSHQGHLMTQEHRISPPGHWLNIVSLVARQEGSDLYTTTKAYTLCAIAMHDALIACWYEKFNTDLVRPITYIQEMIDPEWNTLIQTPPFPEYPSGHSAVSAAAATILDHTYGDRVPFTDSTEVIFGMGARSFSSFQDAAWEVSMSRFWGGIHYMNGIEEGSRQGKDVARSILNRTVVP